MFQVVGSDHFDPFLFARCHIVWLAGRSAHGSREFDSGTRITRQALLLNGDVEHSSQHTELLMDCRRLDPAAMLDAELRTTPPSFGKPPAYIVLDCFRCDIEEKRVATGIDGSTQGRSRLRK